MLDALGQVEYANPADLEGTGLDAHQVLGRLWLAFKSDEDGELKGHVARALTEGVP